MIRKRYLALAFAAAASLFAPLHASALSVNDFEKMNAQQQAGAYTQVVQEAIQEAFKIDQKTGEAVGQYFTTIPPGSQFPKGYTAFDADLQQALKDGQAGKADLDKLQIEVIVFDVIQTQVLPGLAQNTPAPEPKGP
jgi:hypothetical protein